MLPDFTKIYTIRYIYFKTDLFFFLAAIYPKYIQLFISWVGHKLIFLAGFKDGQNHTHVFLFVFLFPSWNFRRYNRKVMIFLLVHKLALKAMPRGSAQF